MHTSFYETSTLKEQCWWHAYANNARTIVDPQNSVDNRAVFHEGSIRLSLWRVTNIVIQARININLHNDSIVPSTLLPELHNASNDTIDIYDNITDLDMTYSNASFTTCEKADATDKKLLRKHQKRFSIKIMSILDLLKRCVMVLLKLRFTHL